MENSSPPKNGGKSETELILFGFWKPVWDKALYFTWKTFPERLLSFDSLKLLFRALIVFGLTLFILGWDQTVEFLTALFAGLIANILWGAVVLIVNIFKFAALKNIKFEEETKFQPVSKTQEKLTLGLLAIILLSTCYFLGFGFWKTAEPIIRPTATSTATRTPTQTLTPTPAIFYNQTEHLIMREAPGANQRAIGSIPKCEAIIYLNGPLLIGESSWFEVIYPPSELRGWVMDGNNLLETLGVCPTPTLTPSPTRLPTNTPVNTRTNTPTPTVTVDPEWEITGDCLLSDPEPPCWYRVTEDSGGYEIIAYNLMGDYDYAGLIAELNRSEDGTIAPLVVGERIIVPNKFADRTLEYYEYYFRLMNLEMRICNSDFSNPPCLFALQENRVLENLIEDIYGRENLEASRNSFILANKNLLEEDFDGDPPYFLSTPQEFERGTIVFVPIVENTNSTQ